MVKKEGKLGQVSWVPGSIRPEKYFCFIKSDHGERIFLSFHNGMIYVDDAWQRGIERFPKPGDYVVFERVKKHGRVTGERWAYFADYKKELGRRKKVAHEELMAVA